jgi:3'-phosphoadenosine 5'-phosphosulfate sulfotransferase (PAPS reductase)/FAD synthetase
MKHIVGFSGGIDSQAVALWARQRFPAEDIILMNTNAGRNEHPLTEAFVQQYSDNVFPVTKVTAIYADLWETPGFAETKGYNSNDELTFEGMIIVKGRPPSRKAQFCTEILKLKPQRRWVRENVTDDYERYTGVRRDESSYRKDTPLREWDNYFDCYVNHPITEWTKDQCFATVMAAGEEFNPLYKLGFKRVGCAPCINSGKNEILLWQQRFPEMIEKVRGWERTTGRTYFAPCVPGLPTNTIDQVLEWAKTSRGGRQIDMIRVVEERPACESKYGLCE